MKKKKTVEILFLWNLTWILLLRLEPVKAADQKSNLPIDEGSLLEDLKQKETSGSQPCELSSGKVGIIWTFFRYHSYTWRDGDGALFGLCGGNY